MKKTTTISYSALLDLMTEAVSNQKSLPNEADLADPPIDPNPSMDSMMSTLELEPSQVVPSTKEDVMWLLRQAIEQVPDESIENLYQQVIGSIEKLKNTSLSPIKPEVDIKSAGSMSGLAAENLSRKEQMLESLLDTIIVEYSEEPSVVDAAEEMDAATSLALLKKLLALNVGEDMEMGSTKWSRKNFANWQSKSEDGVIDDWKKDELIELLADGNYSEDEDSDNPVYDLGDELADEPPPESKGYGPRGNLDGVTYGDIAKEFGFTNQGAKRAVEVAMEKFKFMLGLSDAERLEIVLPAMSDYIDELAATGEVDQEDIQFLKQHPKDVAESDGFRDHMKKFINRAVRKSGKDIEVEEE